MGLSRTVSEIYAISVENRKIFPPLLLCVPIEGIPLELGTGAGGLEKLEWLGQPCGEKKFDDSFSRMHRMHERDRQTDRRTDTGRQQRLRLRIASRGKK